MAAHDALPQDWLLLRGLGREAGHWEPFPEVRRAHFARARTVVVARACSVDVVGTQIIDSGAAGCSDDAHWRVALLAFQALVAALPPGSRVHCVDNPGVGSERHRPSPTSLPDTARDVLRRFHALRRQNGTHAFPFGVLGMSLGGMLALELASRAALEQEQRDGGANGGGANGALCCAVVINTSPGYALARPHRRLRPAGMWGLLRCLWTTAYAREAVLLPLVVNLAERERTLARWRALAAARPLPRRTFFAQLLSAAVWKAPERLRVPLLVLASRADALTCCSCSHTIAAKYAGAALALHDTAGHDLTTDDPAWVAQRVRDWLDGGMRTDGA
jgi:pimeloyl-ACP methyl ester carboxylesterase